MQPWPHLPRESHFVSQTTLSGVNESASRARTISPRYLVGLALIWGGPLVIAAAVTAALAQYGSLRAVPIAIIGLGYLLYLVGWMTLPATLGRRFLGAALGIVALLIYLHTFPGIFTGLQTALGLAGGPFGSTAMGALAQAIAVILVLTAWLIVRSRKPLAFVVLPAAFLVQLVLGFLAFAGGSPLTWPVPFSGLFAQVHGPIVVVGMAGVLIGWLLILAGATWGASAFDRVQRARSARPPEMIIEKSASTNTFAILALVFGLLGGVLGIVFGHIARAQIRHIAERGWGMATTGLVLGYIWLATNVGIVIVYIVAIAIVQGQPLK
jgi:hypothetical protein